MRAFGRGLVAGFLLSLVRVPFGIDLVQWPAVSGEEAYGFRALALAVVVLGVGIFARSCFARRHAHRERAEAPDIVRR